jgi:hypothetical protein
MGSQRPLLALLRRTGTDDHRGMGGRDQPLLDLQRAD